MVARSTSRPDEIAAAWVARIDRELSAGEQAELDAWLAADERHLGALVRARAFFLHADMAKALGPGFRPDRVPEPEAGDVGRRHFLRAAGIAAAAVGLGGLGSAWFWLNGRERYVTRRGEVRAVALSDGSAVTLNAQSEIVVAYHRTGRAIFLRSGEALFDVAKDAARPFTVHAGMMNVTAVGTSFAVSRAGVHEARVVVSEGLVDVRDPAARHADGLRLGANMAAVAVPQAPIRSARLESVTVQRQLQWREGRLQFAGETLEDAAAQFARYSDVAIVIDDPALRREEISGTFVALDPLGFSRAVAEALNAEVDVREGEVHLGRRRS